MILIFLLAAAGVYLILSIDKESRVEEYLQDSAKSFDAEYHIIYRAFDEKAKIIYDTLVDTKEVKSLFANRDREALNQLLQPEYRKLKRYGVKQFHFHLPDNHSFLRLHAPWLYGDDLSGFRATVVYVNKAHRPVGGFEEGIASNGFRFVFPLFLKKEYLGSVEISFDAYVLSDYLRNDYIDTRFIISKKALLHEEHGQNLPSNYQVSRIDSDFVTVRNIEKERIPLLPNIRLRHHYTDEKLMKKSFALFQKIDGKYYVENFIPILNPVTHQLSAYLVIVSDGKYISQIERNFWIVFAAIMLALLLLATRLIRTKEFQRQLHRENRKLQTMIDTLDTMILITDGRDLIEVNQKVLDFFGFDSLEEMTEKYNCICDFFIRKEGYFHLGKVPERSCWIEEIQKLDEKERIVNMIGHDMVAKAFGVKVQSYGENGSYIISFTDVTEMIIEQRLLEYKATHDTLTGIYNRQKLEDTFARLCRYSDRRKEQVGLIMFDIDHFKKINDTYGHDIGDRVLASIATLVGRHIREYDIFGRWGGEEFMIVMRYATAEETYLKARFLRREIAKMEVSGVPKVTASFGVTTLHPADTTQSLLKRVDEALYQAKHSGRNCVVQYSFQRDPV